MNISNYHSPESAGNDEYLYVFTYVGVITYGSRIIKIYPKYLLSAVGTVVPDNSKSIINGFFPKDCPFSINLYYIFAVVVHPVLMIVIFAV